jgi:large-conductance mechanosensitive channel
MNQLSKPSETKKEIAKFLTENNIIGTCAGVIIALASNDLIRSLVNDIIVPVVNNAIFATNNKVIIDYLSLKSKNIVDLKKFIGFFITWLLIILVTFIVLRSLFTFLLGVENKPSNEKDKKKDE